MCRKPEPEAVSRLPLSRVLLALLLAPAVLLVASLFPGSARADDMVADLYTIGPGNYLYARHGHSAICVTGGPHPEGRCYDYGVPDVAGQLTMLWGTLRGEPLFLVVGVDKPTLVFAFSEQERKIERQRLPLSGDEARRLYEILEGAVTTKERYAYHPSTANCTTKLRDALDVATGGKLRDVKPAPVVPRYREILEDGFRGRVAELAVVALFSGTTIERPPSPWEHLFLPSRLRDAVTERFGVKPETVYERQGASIQVSTLGGRLFWIFVGAVLAVLAWRARGVEEKRRRELGTAGFILGLLGLAIWFGAAFFVYPELSHNWALGVLWPTDLALRYLPAKRLRVYLMARLGVIAPLALLSLAGLVSQPIGAIALLAGLPLGVTLLALRAPAPVPATTTPSPPAKSGESA